MKTAESSTGPYQFQLYVYPDSDSQISMVTNPKRIANFNLRTVKKIAESLGLNFIQELENKFDKKLKFFLFNLQYEISDTPAKLTSRF